jgi:hypothetical protein
MARTPSLRLLAPLLPLTLLFAAACSANYTRVVRANPAEATVFINGEKVGTGASRPHKFDFSSCERIFVQATHPDYLPMTEEFTEAKILDMIASNIDVTLPLRSR